MKGKPVVYFSARQTLSTVITRAMKALSRHVTVIGQNEDPEIAYSSINECDVFLFCLNAAVCQQLFLMYEFGVALVLQKPVIVIRETELKFSEILIPKHFHETKLFIPAHKTGVFQTCNVFGKTYHCPMTLGDVLARSYQNSVIFCPDVPAKGIALLLDKIFSLSRELGTLFKERPRLTLKRLQKPTVEITDQNGKPRSGLQGYYVQAGSLNKRVSLLPLKGCETHCNEKLRTNSLVNGCKLPKLSVHENGISVDHAPEISISHLEDQIDHLLGNLNLETQFDPVNPDINELPKESQSSREDADEGLDTSDSSSTCDVTYLHDKIFAASATTSPLPSPIPPRSVYYPTALPVYPMELSFPPFQIEKLHFNKHAIDIAKADKLPSIIRRRIIRKGL